MQPINCMTKLSPDNAVLGLLEAQPSHGYCLLDQFRSTEQLGRIWALGRSQIYAILKRLERDALIEGREESQPDAPMRTVYWLTEHGRSSLYRWLDEPRPSGSTRAIRTEFLSRLYIADLLQHPFDAIINAQRDACQCYHDELTVKQMHKNGWVTCLSLDLRRTELELVIDWLEKCRSGKYRQDAC